MVNIKTLWNASAPLTATTALMLVAFAASCAGLLVDERTITGAPAWMKPAKFAISSAIFSGTMAWLFCYLTVWSRMLRITGRTLAAMLILEVAIIDIQAARGTTSHFNAETVLDGILFSVMGVSIAILWLGSVVVLAALLKQKFEHPAWGWWLRMGMLVTVAGSAAGGMMLRMTPEQTATLDAKRTITTAGAHTVGGPDGGPGLPGVGWSTQHGDLRIPHFLGLHGAQLLPLVGWLVLRRRDRSRSEDSAVAISAGVSYLALIGIFAWQALRGQSIVEPDAATLLALAIWLGGTLAMLGYFAAVPSKAHLAAPA